MYTTGCYISELTTYLIACIAPAQDQDNQHSSIDGAGAQETTLTSNGEAIVSSWLLEKVKSVFFKFMTSYLLANSHLYGHHKLDSVCLLF